MWTNKKGTLTLQIPQYVVHRHPLPPADEDVQTLQLREAHEEVGLPLTSPDIHVLGRLNSSISLHRLIVVPVVGVLTRPYVLNDLKASEDEVDNIFSHPLEAILDPSISSKEPLSAVGSEDWPYEDSEYYVRTSFRVKLSLLTGVFRQNTSDSVVEILGNTTYRMHRFRSSGSPIKGLTSDILVSL